MRSLQTVRTASMSAAVSEASPNLMKKLLRWHLGFAVNVLAVSISLHSVSQ